MSDTATSSFRPIVYPRDQHPISRSLIDPDALKIMYRLLNHGYKAFLVGGGVRDLLLGKRPKDFDISTDAHPNEIRDLFRNSRIIGKRFKLVHVFFRGGKNIEVSTFRDNQEPEDKSKVDDQNSELTPRDTQPIRRDNVYGNEITDALRRDLTINGLYYDLKSYSIIDYVGGVRDLGDGVIRIIGDPLTRFQEDPVRMLRAIRHAARNGFALEKTCAKIISEHAELLNNASNVRIYDELKKDLIFGDIHPTFRALADSGLLKILLPSFDKRLFVDGALLDTTLERLGNMQRNGVEMLASTVLAALTLGLQAATVQAVSTPENCLADIAEVGELSKTSLSPLAVTRRDNEDIVALLRAWKRCFRDNRLPNLPPDLEVEFQILADIFATSLPEEAPRKASHKRSRNRKRKSKLPNTPILETPQ